MRRLVDGALDQLEAPGKEPIGEPARDANFWHRGYGSIHSPVVVDPHGVGKRCCLWGLPGGGAVWAPGQ